MGGWLMGVLRGWLLLRGSGLDKPERNDIMSATSNSLNYLKVCNALRDQWDDAELKHRDQTRWKDTRGFLGSVEESPGTTDPWAADQTSQWFGQWNDAALAWQQAWQSSDPWTAYNVSWNGSQPSHYDNNSASPPAAAAAEAPSGNKVDDDKFKELEEAQNLAESMVAESQRTLAQARAAVSEAKRDRGFGAVVGKGGKGFYGKGKRKGKYGNFVEDIDPEEENFWVEQELMYFKGTGKGGKGPCFICSGPHMAATCPDRRAPRDSKGKGKGSYAAEIYNQAPNYGYGMEMVTNEMLTEYTREFLCQPLQEGDPKTAEVLSTSTGATRTRAGNGKGMMDCGATASAAPTEAITELARAVASVNPEIQITVDTTEGSRPWFRFGTGGWARALFKALFFNPVSSRKFEAFVIPQEVKNSGVPILIGMTFLRENKAIVDFSSGHMFYATVQNPELQVLESNEKGHFLIDIVKFLDGPKVGGDFLELEGNQVAADLQGHGPQNKLNKLEDQRREDFHARLKAIQKTIGQPQTGLKTAEQIPGNHHPSSKTNEAIAKELNPALIELAKANLRRQQAVHAGQIQEEMGASARRCGSGPAADDVGRSGGPADARKGTMQRSTQLQLPQPAGLQGGREQDEGVRHEDRLQRQRALPLRGVQRVCLAAGLLAAAGGCVHLHQQVQPGDCATSPSPHPRVGNQTLHGGDLPEGLQADSVLHDRGRQGQSQAGTAPSGGPDAQDQSQGIDIQPGNLIQPTDGSGHSGLGRRPGAGAEDVGVRECAAMGDGYKEAPGTGEAVRV